MLPAATLAVTLAVALSMPAAAGAEAESVFAVYYFAH